MDGILLPQRINHGGADGVSPPMIAGVAPSNAWESLAYRIVAQFRSSVKPWSRFANIGSRCIRIVRIVAATFFVLIIPWVIAHELRHLYATDGQSIFSTDRREGYFKDSPMIVQPSVDSANVIKNQCRPSNPTAEPDSTPMVFVRLIPVDADDLPDDRKPDGFDNVDFRFNDSNVLQPDDEQCVSIRMLPDYDVARLRTGEYVDDDRLWEAEVSFDA